MDDSTFHPIVLISSLLFPTPVLFFTRKGLGGCVWTSQPASFAHSSPPRAAPRSLTGLGLCGCSWDSGSAKEANTSTRSRIRTREAEILGLWTYDVIKKWGNWALSSYASLTRTLWGGLYHRRDRGGIVRSTACLGLRETLFSITFVSNLWKVPKMSKNQPESMVS